MNSVVKSNCNLGFNQNIMISNQDLFFRTGKKSSFDFEYQTDQINNRNLFNQFEYGHQAEEENVLSKILNYD